MTVLGNLLAAPNPPRPWSDSRRVALLLPWDSQAKAMPTLGRAVFNQKREHPLVPMSIGKLRKKPSGLLPLALPLIRREEDQGIEAIFCAHPPARAWTGAARTVSPPVMPKVTNVANLQPLRQKTGAQLPLMPPRASRRLLPAFLCRSGTPW